MADEQDENKSEETEAPQAAAEGTDEKEAAAEQAPVTEEAPAGEEAPAQEEAAAAEGDAEDDPWGAAMAEQEAGEATAVPAPQPEMPEPTAVVQHRPAATFGELKAEASGKGISNLELILDIPVTISVELGRTQLFIKDLISLGQGAVMELDKLAGDPMEIFVNGHLVAKGETVVVNDRFGIKLTDIVSPTERISNLT